MRSHECFRFFHMPSALTQYLWNNSNALEGTQRTYFQILVTLRQIALTCSQMVVVLICSYLYLAASYIDTASIRKKYLWQIHNTLKKSAGPPSSATDLFINMSFELKQFALLAISNQVQLEQHTYERIWTMGVAPPSHASDPVIGMPFDLKQLRGRTQWKRYQLEQNI